MPRFAERCSSRFGAPQVADVTAILVSSAVWCLPSPHADNAESLIVLLFCVGLSAAAGAAAKAHVITFGKWTSVQWFTGSGTDEKPLTIKIRALIIEGRVKEYAVGAPHEVTERLFVVRRVFRVNDSLPEDPGVHWQWQRGGWLLVDRLTGHVSASNLPELDVYYSPARLVPRLMLPTVEWGTTARRRMRWWRNSAGANRF
jgi:hypothetical protein